MTSSVIPAGVGFHFKCSSRRGAVLVLKQWATREDISDSRDFHDYIRRHADSWYDFAEQKRFNVPNGHSIFMVRGCDKTAEWALAAFEGTSETQGAEVFFNGAFMTAPGARISLQGSWGRCTSAQHRSGPRLDSVTPVLSSLPADVPGVSRRFNQPVFLRTWRVGRRRFMLPRSIKAAAEPQEDDYDSDLDALNRPCDAGSDSSGDDLLVQLDPDPNPVCNISILRN